MSPRLWRCSACALGSATELQPFFTACEPLRTGQSPSSCLLYWFWRASPCWETALCAWSPLWLEDVSMSRGVYLSVRSGRDGQCARASAEAWISCWPRGPDFVVTGTGQVGSDCQNRQPAVSPQSCHSASLRRPCRTSPKCDTAHNRITCCSRLPVRQLPSLE